MIRIKKAKKGKKVAPRLKANFGKALKPFRGKTKTNGRSGRDKEFYEWDYTHDEIEVYDHQFRPKRVLDPKTGKPLDKDPSGHKPLPK